MTTLPVHKETHDERLAREKRERLVVEQSNLQLAQEIAVLTSMTLEPPHKEYGYNSHYSLVNSKGFGFTLVFNEYGNKGKLRVRGDYCGEIPYKEVRPSINVSASKGALQILKDINRRFWTEYVELEMKCRELKKNKEETATKLKEHRDFLLACKGITDSQNTKALYIRTKSCYGEISYVSIDGTCNVSLNNIRVEQMQAIVHILNVMELNI